MKIRRNKKLDVGSSTQSSSPSTCIHAHAHIHWRYLNVCKSLVEWFLSENGMNLIKYHCWSSNRHTKKCRNDEKKRKSRENKNWFCYRHRWCSDADAGSHVCLVHFLVHNTHLIPSFEISTPKKTLDNSPTGRKTWTERRRAKKRRKKMISLAWTKSHNVNAIQEFIDVQENEQFLVRRHKVMNEKAEKKKNIIREHIQVT